MMIKNKISTARIQRRPLLLLVLLAVGAGVPLAVSQTEPGPSVVQQPSASSQSGSAIVNPIIRPQPVAPQTDADRQAAIQAAQAARAAQAGQVPHAAHAPRPAPVTADTAIETYTPEGLTVYYMGRRNGEIEPCGCTKNQLGGIQYEATLLDQVAKDLSLRVDVGNWNIQGGTPESALKSEYALRAMASETMNYDAINLADADLALGKGYLDKIATENPAVFELLVSANIHPADDRDRLAFSPYRIVNKKLPGGKEVTVAITGVAGLNVPYVPNNQAAQSKEVGGYVITDANQALIPLLALLRHKADLLVVLASGSWHEMLKIAEANPGVDLIVSSSPAPDYQKKYMVHEGVQIAGSFGSLGKMLGRIELRDSEGRWLIHDIPSELPVSPKQLTAVEPMVELIADYKKRTESLSQMMPTTAELIYAGAQTCANCHQAEYQDWQQNQRHAHAMDTLVAKGSQFDPACLKCHTVGFQHQNGFWNFKQSKHLMGVQCENCHGPSKTHVDKQNYLKHRSLDSMTEEQRNKLIEEAKAAIPPKMVGEETCTKCHYGDNDPHFVYDVKIHHVNHKGENHASLGEIFGIADGAPGHGAAGGF